MTKTIEERAREKVLEIARQVLKGNDPLAREGREAMVLLWVAPMVELCREQAREDARIAQQLSDEGAPITESIEEGRGWDRGAAAAAQAILAQLQQGGKTNES